MKHSLYEIVRSSVLTEKANTLASMNKITLVVQKQTDKESLKLFFTNELNLDVKSVNVLNVKSKSVSFRNTAGKKSGYKKAIITFTEPVDLKKILESL